MSESDAKELHPRDALAQYLLEVFPGAEITRFIGDNFGAEVEDDIPHSPVRATLVDEALAVLERRGLLAEALFVELTRHTPGLTDRVLALARGWCDPAAVDRFVRTRGRPTQDGGGDGLGPAASDAVAARVDLGHRLARDCRGWRVTEAGVIECSGSTDPTELGLDITVLNRLDEALVITGLGLHIARIFHPERARPAAGVAFGPAELGPRKIAVFDAVRVSLGRYSDLQWRTIYDLDAVEQAVERAFVEELEDPVLLPSQAAVRFKLTVEQLFMSREVGVRARLLVTTQRGLLRSRELVLAS